MKKKQVIRAWRDPEYFASLSEADRACIPDHPAGVVELSDQDLNGLSAADGAVINTQVFETICITIFPGSQLCVFRRCDEP